MTTAPALRSLALDEIQRPDYADVIVVPVPAVTTTDPKVWAKAVFDVTALPWWIKGLFGVRQALVRLIGVSKAPADIFKVTKVAGEEALIVANAGHLDFACGVGLDSEQQLLRVTTTVRLHGWRGKVYFAPVSVLHPMITRAMAQSAVRRLGK